MHRLIPIIVAALAARTRNKTAAGRRRRGIKVMISGIPGIGKTAMLTQLAEALQVQFWGLATSIYGPQDFNGIPIVVEGEPDDKSGSPKATGRYLSFAPPKWALASTAAAEKEGFAIVLMDEINTCSKTTQQALLKVLSEGQVGDLQLHENVLFVFAGNPPECGGRPLTPAFSNRLLHLIAEPDVQDKMQWCDWLDGAASEDDVLSHAKIIPHGDVDAAWDEVYAKHAKSVADFHRKSDGTHMWCDMPSIDSPTEGVSGPSGAWPSKRSWAQVVDALTTAEIHGLSDEDTILMGIGSVGESAFMAYMEWASSSHLQVDPVEFFASGCDFDLSQEIDIVSDMLRVCCEYALKGDDATKVAFWKFLGKVYDSEKATLALAAVEAMTAVSAGSRTLRRVSGPIIELYGDYINKKGLA